MEGDSETSKENEDLILNPDSFFSTIRQILNNVDYQINQIMQLEEDEDHIIANFNRLLKILNFKITSLIVSLLDLEKEILSSPMDDYYSHVLMMDYYPIQTKNKIERLTDSILTQYFSIIDVFIKFISKTKRLSQEVDSLGALYRNLDNKSLSQEESKIFSTFIDYRDNLEDIKAYRDFLIHHSSVNIEPVKEPLIDKKHPIKSYYMNVVKRQKGRSYTQSKKTQQKVNFFLRYHIFILFDSIEKCLNEMRLEYFDKRE